ncbi:MAG: hypothetical protein AABO57_28560 [Acidobacteriota bacterium]
MYDTLITALAAVGGFLAKSVWDLYWKRKEQHESVARQKRLDFLEKQLSQFYWPIYLQLQKNNVVWEHLVSGKAINDSLKKQVDSQLYSSFFLPNHENMLKIIEMNIHLAQPDEVLEKILLRFIRHVAIFEALREVGIKDVDPIALGEPWPTELFPAIEARLKKLQEEYDKELGRRRNVA